MNTLTLLFSGCIVPLILASTVIEAGEKPVVSLRDMRKTELKSAGITVSRTTTVSVRGIGGGGGSGWFSRNDGMFASGWIIDAKTRSVVWEMNRSNTAEAGDHDRSCDEKIQLKQGAYEVYFAAPTFSYHSWTNHLVFNVDHRREPLFDDEGGGFLFFKGLWSDDIPEEWERRAKMWGIDLLVDDVDASSIGTFDPPARMENVFLQETGVGDGVRISRGVNVESPVTVNVYAIGEGVKGEPLVDFGWMVSAETRKPVWEMNPKNTVHAGGAEKNRLYSGRIDLAPGRYVLYYVTDDSHSLDDWNSFPPYDPLHWGVTVTTDDRADAQKLGMFDYDEFTNVIVAINAVGDEEHHRKGFSLKEDADVRIYAFGERGIGRRTLADFGYIIDARTREKVWSMDVDRCRHAGGAAKNVFIDEVVNLPKGSYLVFYDTDDSHSFDGWNANPPYDAEHYGVTVMGAGKFDPGIAGKYVDPREEGVISQIIRVGNNADESRRFTLDRTTRVRVYAIGEGQKRTMYDYGWIENAALGTVVWEMTYMMTLPAGGNRKNRMVNTGILLDKGEYVLRYVTDDSHAFNSWNTDPPEDQEYWGITLYRESADAVLAPPAPPAPPAPDR